MSISPLLLALPILFSRQISFHIYLLYLQKKYDLRITSYIRSKKHNADVGGHQKSQHLTGLAADVVLPNKDRKTALLEDIKIFEMTAIDEGDHIHIQYAKS